MKNVNRFVLILAALTAFAQFVRAVDHLERKW